MNRFTLISLVVSALLGNAVYAQEEPSYLITSPNRFIPGRPETVCVELFNAIGNTTLDFELKELWLPRDWMELPSAASNRTLDQVSINMTLEEQSKCFQMTVPVDVIDRKGRDSDADSLVLKVRGTSAAFNETEDLAVEFTDDISNSTAATQVWSFQDEVLISFLPRYSNSEMVFIHTDKPIYKPGQLVKFRVLTLDTQLKPTTQPIPLMYVSAPNNAARLQQWRNVLMENGMAQFEFQLADEPALGYYTIMLESESGQSSQTNFEVKEYVLPRFEVTVTPPKHITFQTEYVEAKICAKYTFGKNVNGKAEAKVCVRESKWFIDFGVLDYESNNTSSTTEDSEDSLVSATSNTTSELTVDVLPGNPDAEDDDSLCTYVTGQLEDGCFLLNVSRMDVGWDRYNETYKWGVSLDIEAKVQEEGTGVYVNATDTSLSFERYNMMIQLEGPERYKPGLAYQALAKVTDLDGNPIANELVTIEINDWGSYGKYSKNYTSDENGEVKFSIPPVVQNIPSFNIVAKVPGYFTKFFENSGPEAYLYVNGWYSPSGSFLQIKPTTETLECGSTKTFTIQFTTSDEFATELRYKVIGTGDIVTEGSMPLNISLTTPIDEPEEDNWDRSEINPCFWNWLGCREGEAVIDRKKRQTESDSDGLDIVDDGLGSDPLPSDVDNFNSNGTNPVAGELETPNGGNETEIDLISSTENSIDTDLLNATSETPAVTGEVGEPFNATETPPVDTGLVDVDTIEPVVTATPLIENVTDTDNASTATVTEVNVDEIEAVTENITANADNATEIFEAETTEAVTTDTETTEAKTTEAVTTEATAELVITTAASNETETLSPLPEDEKANVTVATHRGTFEVEVEITPEMSTSGMVVFYYVKPDGEVVSDGIRLDVEPCSNNNVNMTFSTDVAHAGDNITIEIEANPGSSCSYSVVDQSVFLAGGNNQLTLQQALDNVQTIALNEWSGPWRTDSKRCNLLRGEEANQENEDGISFNWDTTYEDASNGFKKGGLVYMSNLLVESKPCLKQYYRSHVMPFTTAFAGESGNSAGAPAADGSPSAVRAEKPSNTVRSFFPETWLWNIIMTDNDTGLATIETKAPDTITQWIGNAVCVHETDGLGVADPVNLTVFQPFFVHVSLPYSVIRDEKVPIAVTVYNYMEECMPVRLSINEMSGYTVLDKPSALVCVCPNATQTEKFYVVMRDLDLNNVSVSAEVVDDPLTCKDMVGEAVLLNDQMALKGDELNGTDPDARAELTEVTEVIDPETLTINATANSLNNTLEVLNLTADEMNTTLSNSSDDTLLVNDEPAQLSGFGKQLQEMAGMKDTVIRPVLVAPEGSPRQYTVSDLVCIKSGDNLVEVIDGEQTITTNYSLPLPEANDLVFKSERAYVSVVGDIMGPALSNIDRLLNMPYGCAEQTMVSLAPNIFILQYLEAINKVDESLERKAKEYMRSGYMRELTYAHDDQSYSSFGTSEPEKPGSMWLTAFVVKCFGLAEPYIFIDESVQNKSIDFFKKHQDEDGCFPQIGTVHNKYMQGGLGNGADTNSTNNAALTAYVAIAMMEAGYRDEDILAAAFSCISGETFNDSYTTSIVAYAHSLYDPMSNTTMEWYETLYNMSVTGETGEVHWKAMADEPEKPKLSFWWFMPQPADVEATSYALLTMLNVLDDNLEKLEVGLPIVRWLTTQRNAWGGFGSTQDTVIGLQALSKFAALYYSNGTNAKITVTETNSGKEVATFDINEDNSLVQFSQKLTTVTNLTVTASGTGCFLFQANVRYNVDKTDNDDKPFTTSANVFRRLGSTDSCKMRFMRICSSYQGEGGVSNMVIISVNMVSGWTADSGSLKTLVKEGKVDRYEVDEDGTVQIYLLKLDSQELCFNFDIDQVFDVKDAKDAVVTTYDYYKPELRHDFRYQIGACQDPSEEVVLPVIEF